jgi:predicted kinase
MTTDRIGDVDGVVYLSLDWGIAWSYKGAKYPTVDCWAWATSNPLVILNYIDKLRKNGLLPVLYSYGANQAFIKLIESFFIEKPIIKVAQSLELIHQEISKEYNFHENKIYRIGPPSTVGYYQSLEDIGIDPLNNFDTSIKQILIIMGQTGSGKTRITNRLKEQGWYVVDERQGDQIVRLSKINSQVIKDFETLVRTHPRLVIDSENARASDRQVFIDIAVKYGIKYLVGWVSRPSSYHYSKSPPVPEEVLQNFTNRLEIPTIENGGFRLL